MDEREDLAASFGHMRRAMIPAFLLDLLGAVESDSSGGSELSLTQLATLYVLDAGEPVSLGALAGRGRRRAGWWPTPSARPRRRGEWCGCVSP